MWWGSFGGLGVAQPGFRSSSPHKSILSKKIGTMVPSVLLSCLGHLCLCLTIAHQKCISSMDFVMSPFANFTKGLNWTTGIYSSKKRLMMKKNLQKYILYLGIIYLTIKGLCWWGALWDTSLDSAQNNPAGQTSVSAAVRGRCGPESQDESHDRRERESAAQEQSKEKCWHHKHRRDLPLNLMKPEIQSRLERLV